MKCVISSTYNPWASSDTQPCVEAVQEMLISTLCGDTRRRKLWTIELADLSALLGFCRKYGECIVQESNCVECPMEIEIYDSYRE